MTSNDIATPPIAHASRHDGSVRDRLRALSPSLVVATAGFAVLGLGTGLWHYVNRSATLEKHGADTAAWWQHGIIAAVAVVLLLGAYARHRRHGCDAEAVLLAPWGRRAAARLAATWRRPSWRTALSIPLLVLVAYNAWRVGDQVIGGIDPNYTANAWGGPSYLGAMACHYLDCGLLVAVAGWLLSRVLVSAPRSQGR